MGRTDHDNPFHGRQRRQDSYASAEDEELAKASAPFLVDREAEADSPSGVYGRASTARSVVCGAFCQRSDVPLTPP